MSIPSDIPTWADVKIYNNAGLYTWTKPTWAKMIYYNIISAGNGGGGGFSRTSGQGGGGGGGCEGNALFGVNPAALFPNTLYIRVGKGGQGGTANQAGAQGQSTNAFTLRSDAGGEAGLRLWDGQIGGVGNPGTVSTGGTVSTSNAANNTSRVGNFGICLANGTQQFGQAGSANGTVSTLIFSPTQIAHGGAGGAGISSTNFAGRGGGYHQAILGAAISEFSLTTQFLRGGHGASVALKGNGISNTRANPNCTATVTFETGETVIIGISTTFGYPDRTYVTSVTDGTHTYEAITPFVVPSTGGQSSVQLYKADNVTAGTYNIIGEVLENGVRVDTQCVAWYRYDGLSSGPVLATATSSQSGTGGITTNGITCGPLSSTATPCLLFAATTAQNNGDPQQRVEPGSSINRFIEHTNRSPSHRITAGDSLITTTSSVTAQFTVFDTFTNRTTAAVLIGVKTNQLEPKAGDGMDGNIYWLSGTIVPFIRGGAGGGSSHFTEGGDGGDGGPGCSGGGGGAGNPGGRGGNGGDGICIIACW